WRTIRRYGCTRKCFLWSWWQLRPPRPYKRAPAASEGRRRRRRESPARRSAPRTGTRKERGGQSRLPPQNDLLHAPTGDLGDQDFVLVPAIQFVRRTEFARPLAGPAKL